MTCRAEIFLGVGSGKWAFSTIHKQLPVVEAQAIPTVPLEDPVHNKLVEFSSIPSHHIRGEAQSGL